MTPNETVSAPTLALIRELEEVAADSVPAAVATTLGGWRLRFNHGVKRRPNSVLANRDDATLTLAAKLEHAEAFYAAHGLKARFQLCAASLPAGLDEALAARGYRRVPESVCVQVAPPGRVRPISEAHAAGTKVALSGRPSEEFFELYNLIDGLSGVKATAFREMLAQLPGKPVFALAHTPDGRPAATGVGVAHGGWLGLFNIGTHPSARRQGLASAVVTALLRWGEEKALSGAYLQVSAANTGAQAVYERLEFKTLYEYFYREQP